MESFVFFQNAVILPADRYILYFLPCTYLFDIVLCPRTLAITEVRECMSFFFLTSLRMPPALVLREGNAPSSSGNPSSRKLCHQSCCTSRLLMSVCTMYILSSFYI